MLRILILALFPLPALACETPVCLVDPDSLVLMRVIDFDDQPSSWDPGRKIDEELRLGGASFAERFAGQTLGTEGDFDTVSGAALPPLTLVPGRPGQTLSVVSLNGSNTLNGFGPAGFPRHNAQGEGAIAVLFEKDQPAFSFELLGGEHGTARIQFLRRDGTLIHAMTVAELERGGLGFWRQDGVADIAGFVLTNLDPQGIAIDDLRFGPPPQLG